LLTTYSAPQCRQVKSPPCVIFGVRIDASYTLWRSRRLFRLAELNRFNTR
jgi:hypothetical protein